MVWSRWTGWDKTWVSSAEVRDYRQRSRLLRDVAAWNTGQANLTGNGDPERVGAGQVTANILRALGAGPMLGRGFREGEDATGDGAAVVLLGHGLWQRRFGGDPTLVGKTIQLDGRSYEVIGVMPSGFRLPTDFREDFAEPTSCGGRWCSTPTPPTAATMASTPPVCSRPAPPPHRPTPS